MFLILITVTLFCNVIEGSSSADFKVLTEECHIPYFPVFSSEINFQRQNYTSCTNDELLTSTRVKNNTAFLSINEARTKKYEKQLSCCFSYITRNGSEEKPDVGISLSDCINFNETVKLEEEGAVLVKCRNDTDVVYINVHNPITITDPVRKKLDQNSIGNNHNVPFNVLIIVIDSVSRLNFNRTMPKTRAFLLQNGFNDFLAYNKVDDNTFPNAMALLSGMTLKQVYSTCHPGEVGNLDQCPLIWYQYRDAGYVTAYAEDWADIATFNYQKKGFQKPPTDYYFKPYIEAAELLNITMKDGMPYCAGPVTEEDTQPPSTATAVVH